MRHSLVPALALLSLVAACQEEQLVQNPGGGSGRVCNPITGRPAVGAKLSVTFVTEGVGEQTKEVVADDNGFFELAGIAAGPQTIDVETDEFQTTFDVVVDSKAEFLVEDPSCRDLPPTPGFGTVAGQICNRHVGEILKDAQIILTLPDGTVDDGCDGDLVCVDRGCVAEGAPADAAAPACDPTNFTNPATGDFSLQTPTGTVVVTVSAPSFRKTYVVEVLDSQIVVVEQSSDCSGGPLLSTGFITGDICAPDPDGGGPEVQGGPLADATVVASWTDGETDSVETVETITDVDGHFELLSLDPDDNITVRVTKTFEDGSQFALTWNVRAGENGGPLRDRTSMPDGLNLTATSGCDPLLPDDGRRYLVVEGIYDRIEDTLRDRGLEPEIEPFPTGLGWANDLFSNRERIEEFDVIFVNCGAEDSEFATPGGLSAAAKDGLRRYLEAGGSLYVSDWSYELVEQMFPEKIDFFGADSTFDAAQQAVGGTYGTRVLDDDLASFLGRRTGSRLDNFDISFSFQAGSIITQVGPGVTRFLETDMNYRHDGVVDTLESTPVTVGFDVGLGKVIFTSFHQEQDPSTVGFVDDLNDAEDDVLEFMIFEL
ncbi:MAG: carboxypeptidase-like regulatory domain-containing protein [Deltaproteobacteria bacterium]|nr:carboxypeptidase-like regulatory domain-containing protein [Deltaproteobacteria bacterium]